MSAIILGETAAIAYNTAAGTTSALLGQAQENYARLAAENEALKKSVNLINRAYSEDKKLLEVVDLLAASKPDGVKLLKLEAANGVISIEGYAANPSAFHDYVENLKTRHDLFVEPRLEKISSPAPAYKTGVITATLAEIN